MAYQKKTQMAMLGGLIQDWTEESDRIRRDTLILPGIMWVMAMLLKAYCKKQGNSCEGCIFVLADPERKSCECRINIGKNECGTAPRFWELAEKRDHEDKERIDTDGQLGAVLPVREKGE